MKPADPVKLFRVLHALCSRRFPGDADDQRFARLQWISLLLNREVRSSKDLSVADLQRCVDQLLNEVPADIARRYRLDGRQTRRKQRGNVVEMPRRNAVTRHQAWKIDQLQAYLGWSDAGTSKFIRDKFGSLPHELTFRDAVAAIEAMIHAAARRDLKARQGEAHPVNEHQLAIEVTALKAKLRTWRPAPPEADPPPPEAA